MSNTKLGLLVLWPSFWTGFPIKLVLVLLMLAAGVHPWEGTGLYGLLLLSVPIDIWAIGLCARTVFFERLRVEPQPGLGLTLWWQWTILNVIYLPLLYVIMGAVVSTAKSATAATIEFLKEHVIPGLPIAEQISIELVMWGSAATVVLIILILGWLYGLGAIAQRHVRASTQAGESYQDVVHHWDLLRVPADQPLLLTAFTGTGVVLAFLFWGLLPVSTPHPHEEYEFLSSGKEVKVIKPAEVLKHAEKVLAQASLTVEELEKKEGKSDPTAEAKQAGGNGKGIEKPASGKAEGKKASMGADGQSQDHEHSEGDHQH